jgi:hypothetical protein
VISKQLHDQRTTELHEPVSKGIRNTIRMNTEAKISEIAREADDISTEYEKLKNREKQIVNLEAKLIGYKKMRENNTEDWILCEHAEGIIKAKDEYVTYKNRALTNKDVYNQRYSAQKERPHFETQEYYSPKRDASMSLYSDIALLKQKEAAKRHMQNKKSRLTQESLLRTHMENLQIVESIQSQLNNYVI